MYKVHFKLATGVSTKFLNLSLRGESNLSIYERLLVKAIKQKNIDSTTIFKPFHEDILSLDKTHTDLKINKKVLVVCDVESNLTNFHIPLKYLQPVFIEISPKEVCNFPNGLLSLV